MDRSSTPRVSQLPQSRRQKNRSRSGSEELNQILSQGWTKASPSMSASSSSSGISASVTPVPEPVARMNSPGLLSWVRNALLSGPGSRNSMTSSLSAAPMNSKLREDDGNGEDDGDDGEDDEEDQTGRNAAPLFPGSIPFFNRKVSPNRDKDQSHIPHSARSSMSLEAPSTAGASSLEPYNTSQRRLSSVSTSSTVYDDNDSSESDEEDVYAPFTPKEHGPSLIRPTARREPIPLGQAEEWEEGGEKEDGWEPPSVFSTFTMTQPSIHDAKDSNLGIGISHAISEGESRLSFNEGESNFSWYLLFSLCSSAEDLFLYEPINVLLSSMGARVTFCGAFLNVI
jgi:hypothetical protein